MGIDIEALLFLNIVNTQGHHQANQSKNHVRAHPNKQNCESCSLELNPELADALASGVQFNYGQFVKLVAQGRDLDLETASTLAQGQVWGAPDALDLKLVDKLGGLEDAIASAATRVGLKDYEVEYVELPRSTEELLLQRLAERVGSINGWSQLPMVASLVQLLAPVTEAAAELASLQDPRHLYMRCISCGMVP